MKSRFSWNKNLSVILITLMLTVVLITSACSKGMNPFRTNPHRHILKSDAELIVHYEQNKDKFNQLFQIGRDAKFKAGQTMMFFHPKEIGLLSELGLKLMFISESQGVRKISLKAVSGGYCPVRETDWGRDIWDVLTSQEYVWLEQPEIQLKYPDGVNKEFSSLDGYNSRLNFEGFRKIDEQIYINLSISEVKDFCVD